MGANLYIMTFFLFTLCLDVQSCSTSSSKPAAAKFHAETNNGIWWPEDLKESSANAHRHHYSDETDHEDEDKNSYKQLPEISNETSVNEERKSGSTSNSNRVNNDEQPQITHSREPHSHDQQQADSISYYQENEGSGSASEVSSSSSLDLIESSISTVPQLNLNNNHHHREKQSSGSNNNGNSNGRRLHPKSTQGLELVHFSNKSITCNDGSPAGYYIRKSTMRGNDDNLWIIFLEGGWYCFDHRSCMNRWHRLKHLMSSDGWPNVKTVGGILSSDPNENPYWWNANHIFIPYCSSDTWSGRVRGNKNGNPFSFMGAVIIDEVIKNLVKYEGLDSDSSVILAGSSAGGTGVMINLDHVESLLTQEFGSSDLGNPRVRGITDSGWFIDKVPLYAEKVNCHDVILCPPEISLRKGMNLWEARLPESCRRSHPDEPWSCFFGYRIYPTLKASLFVFQWLFDEAQMIVNNVPTPALKKEEWDYVYKVGDELKKTLQNVTNVFIPSCLAHTVLTHRDWRRVEVNSVELTKALKCWESGGIIEESNFIPKKKSVQKYWNDDDDEIESSLHSSDSHRGIFRHGKVYSSTPSYSSSSSSSSISPSSSPSSVNGNYKTVVISNDSSRRNRRRHNRHRHNKQSNSQTHRQNRRRRKKLEKRMKIQQQKSGRSRTSKSTKTERALEVVTTIESASPVGNRNINVHSTKPISSNISSSSHNSNSNNNNGKNKNKHKKRKRNRRWYSICDAATGVSRRGGATEIQLIEKCSWPQCNKSCPKLLNPLTGEEVDFKDLLKSFGLDLATMAKALGIDLATLNSMDHQVLLQMLTQHA